MYQIGIVNTLLTHPPHFLDDNPAVATGRICVAFPSHVLPTATQIPNRPIQRRLKWTLYPQKKIPPKNRRDLLSKFKLQL